MAKKVVPIVLLIIIIAVAGVAYKFYEENLGLAEGNERLRLEYRTLQEEKAVLERNLRDRVRERDGLQADLDRVNRTLNEIERERNDLRSRYRRVAEERDALAERLREQPERTVRIRTPEAPQPQMPDDYWADFVREKAELEAKVEELQQNILNVQSEMAQLRKENRELSLQTDEARKDQDRLEQDIRRKERALRVMSIDLVSERQRRGQAVDELTKLRSESADLKRELIVANERKSVVQKRLRDVLEERSNLERKISEAENILKEKSLTLQELQVGLARVIKEGKDVAYLEPGAIELPPIVVRPEAPDLRGLRGEIIAVNPEERFVVFDLGEESGLRPGAVLRVVRGDREIATLEVIETRKSISAADIREISSGFNIREGDSVIAAR